MVIFCIGIILITLLLKILGIIGKKTAKKVYLFLIGLITFTLIILLLKNLTGLFLFGILTVIGYKLYKKYKKGE